MPKTKNRYVVYEKDGAKNQWFHLDGKKFLRPRGYPFETDLRKNERGTNDGTPFKQSAGNLYEILDKHPFWAGAFAWDEFMNEIVFTRPIYWPIDIAPEKEPHDLFMFTDADVGRIKIWVERIYGINLSKGEIYETVETIANKKITHSVRDFLASLKWDKKPRLDTWLVKYAGAEDNEYTKMVGAKLLIGAVARVMYRNKGIPGGPGCKLDTMVVFEGDQGLRKSSMIELLFYKTKGWYSGTPFKMGTKDGYQTLHRKWGLEIPELSHFDRAEMNDIKAFLSTSIDNYRESYGRRNKDFKRQSICIGTTNDREWHKDNTGGRRFWPVFLNGVLVGKIFTINLEDLKDVREQLWAEAVARYLDGEDWWIRDTEMARKAAEEIEKRRHIDPWEASVASWLEGNPSRFKVGVTSAEVMTAMQVKVVDRTKAHEMRVGTIMRALGWERRERKDSVSRYRYFPRNPETTLVGPTKPVVVPLKKK